MKTKALFFSSLALLAIACTKENLVENSGNNSSHSYIPLTLSANVETKTILNNDAVNWLDKDKIAVFDNSSTASSHNNLFTIVKGGSTDANFKGEVPDDATEFIALYPYSSEASLTESGRVSTSLSPSQNALPDSFDDDLAIMIAKANGNSLPFKNVCSHIKFNLDENINNVVSITLIGNKAEVLAGDCSIEWNNGNPIVYPTSGKQETYVTLRNANGTELEAGRDYYFTVFPVTFEEGFTIILSKNDGSQIARKTTIIKDEISNRNTILPLKKLTVSDYSAHMNYFVKYNDGFPITIGGINVNKTDFPGAILVSDNRTNSGNLASNQTGIYFIDPNCTTAKFNKAQSYQTLIVIGANANQRSNVLSYRAIRPLDNGNLILLANLECNAINEKNKSINVIAQNSAGTFENFGDIIISNCHFKNVGDNFFLLNLTVIKSLNIKVEDSEFGLSANKAFINTVALESQLGNVDFNNNIFYVQDDATVTGYQVMSCYNTTSKTGVTVKNTNFTYNTLVGTAGGYFIRIYDTGTCKASNNLFVNTATSSSNANIIAIQNTSTAATGDVTTNYYFCTEGKVNKGSVPSSVSSSTPKALMSNPLSSQWKPASGTFGPYSIEFSDGSTAATVGAQRPDMVTPTNTAAYRYAPNELGSF